MEDVSQIISRLNEHHGKESVSYTRKRVIFAFLMITQAVSNLDTGACCILFSFPSGEVTESFQLSAVHVGSIGGVMYVGHTIGCIIAGHLVQKFHPRMLLSLSLLMNVLCLVGFSLSNEFSMFITCRLVSGIVSAMIVVYGPVWVDEFAHHENSALWLALVQGGVAIGVMLGYVGAGFMASSTSVSWRYFFIFQAGLTLLCSFFFMSVDGRLLNHVLHLRIGCLDSDAQDEKQFHFLIAVRSMIHDTMQVLRQLLFVFPLMALCSLYFVVTGLQLWATSYLKGAPVNAELQSIVIAFGTCSATAPVSGVIFGGWCVDRLGGYKANKRRVAQAASLFGLLGCLASFGCLLVENLVSFSCLIWLLLFFGGAVVPCAVGLCISSAPIALRSLASGFCSASYNLLGMFLGPFVGGAVADTYGIQWGFRTVMGCSAIAVVCMLAALCCATDIDPKNQLAQSINTVIDDEIKLDHASRNSIVSPESFHLTEVRKSVNEHSARCVPLDKIEETCLRLGRRHFITIS